MQENEKVTVSPEEPGDGEKEQRDAFGQTAADDRQAHLDFLTSVILIVACIVIVIVCQGYYQQQLSRRVVTTFYESVGFMPTVFAAFLLVMALILLIKSIRQGSVMAHLKQLAKSANKTVHSKKFWKAIGGLVMFAIYVYGLLGNLSFGVASFIVLFATLIYTHLEKNVKTWLKMLIIALCASTGIVLLFQYAFSVPMP